MLISLTNTQEKILVVSNGLYGDRLLKIFKAHKRNVLCVNLALSKSIDVSIIRLTLEQNQDVKKIALVHFETSTGVLNDLGAVLSLAQELNCKVLVDATSSFAAIELNFSAPALLAVTGSVNKCLHSVPGFGFVFVKKLSLIENNPNESMFSLNLHAQWQEFEHSGQWRFTPPIQAMSAANEALLEYENTGGALQRLTQYSKLNNRLVQNMHQLSIKPAISEKYRAPMITLFTLPAHYKMRANELMERLEQDNIIIYFGHPSFSNSFRIGCIGELTLSDIDLLHTKLECYLNE